MKENQLLTLFVNLQAVNIIMLPNHINSLLSYKKLPLPKCTCETQKIPEIPKKEKKKKYHNLAYSFVLLSLRHNDLGLRFQKTTEKHMDQSLENIEQKATELAKMQKEFLQTQKTHKKFETYQNVFFLCGSTLAVLSSAYLALGASSFVAQVLIFSGLASLANEILTRTNAWNTLAEYLTKEEKQKLLYASTMKTLFATTSLFASVFSGIYGTFQISQNLTTNVILQGMKQVLHMSSFLTGVGVDIYENKTFTTKAILHDLKKAQEHCFSNYDSSANSLEYQMQHLLYMTQLESLVLQEYAQAQRIASSGA